MPVRLSSSLQELHLNVTGAPHSKPHAPCVYCRPNSSSPCHFCTHLPTICTYTHMPCCHQQVRTVLLLGLFQLHLVRRALESSLIMRYRPDDAMHGIAYLFGMR